MNEVRLCALNRGFHSLRNGTSLRKILNDATTQGRLSLNLKRNFRTANNSGRLSHSNCPHVLRQRLLLKDEIQESLCRRFKSQASGPNERGKIALWKRLAIVASISGVMGYTFYSVNREKELTNEQVRYEEFVKAELGGDWALIDHHGNKRSSTEFRGEWILLYFGFTHCPDICPEELEKLTQIVKSFDDNSKLPSMMPIFITLDPERDTPQTIKDYLNDFKCPRLLGFTAPTEGDIKEVATKYRAYFSKGIPDADNDYIVDHTIIIYLVNPRGEFVNYFDRSISAERIINTVTEHIHKYNKLEGRKI